MVVAKQIHLRGGVTPRASSRSARDPRGSGRAERASRRPADRDAVVIRRVPSGAECHPADPGAEHWMRYDKVGDRSLQSVRIHLPTIEFEIQISSDPSGATRRSTPVSFGKIPIKSHCRAMRCSVVILRKCLKS